MVSTDDRALQNIILMLRSHGWSKDVDPAEHRRLVRRHRVDDFHSPFVFYEPGFNLRSTDLNAFIGLGQLRKLPSIIAARRRNHALYLKRLGGR